MTIPLRPGVLIAIEGIDGAGKTTQAGRLATLLADVGFEVVRTKEPTDGPHGRRIRASATTGRLSPEAELQAFLDDRAEHVETLIRPALQRGAVVIVDRYYFSTVAYQGARGLDPAELLRLNAFAPEPDLLVLIDVPPQVGLDRVGVRGDTANLFEQEDALARSLEIFRGMEFPYAAHIDGRQSIDEVTSAILLRLVDGPLLGRLCLKGLAECEPQFCTHRLDRSCQWVGPVSGLAHAAAGVAAANEAAELLDTDPERAFQMVKRALMAGG